MKILKMKNQNRILTTLLAVSMSLSFLACSQTKKEESSQSETTEEIVETKEASISTEQAQAILSAYLKIKDALVDTNGESASAAANDLLSVVADASGDGLLVKVKSNAENISLSTDTQTQRKDFKTLSGNVYTLLKSTSANETPVYQQFCPMAFKGQGGYWLSSEEEILNPYFGDKMLTCGAVKETLN